MTPSGASDTGLRARLRGAGLRVTGVRLGIMRVLAAARVGLDAQEVSAKLNSSTTDRVTVYRTLNALVEKGLAHRIDPGDRVFRFRLTAEAGPGSGGESRGAKGGMAEGAGGPTVHGGAGGGHPHFVCDACGAVECLDDAEVVVQSKPVATARARRYKVVEQNVTLHGVCETCDEHPPAPGAVKSVPGDKTRRGKGRA
ncbi:MAG: Fur family transcriptional regulator [Phycisphaerales bacterium]